MFFLKKNTNTYFRSNTANDLAKKLRKLIAACKKNLK